MCFRSTRHFQKEFGRYTDYIFYEKGTLDIRFSHDSFEILELSKILNKKIWQNKHFMYRIRLSQGQIYLSEKAFELLRQFIYDENKNICSSSKKQLNLTEKALDKYTYNKDISKNVKLHVVFDQMNSHEIAKELCHKVWSIYRIAYPSEKKCFYTSDNPVVVCDIKGDQYNTFQSGILNCFTVVMYPISADLLIAIYGGVRSDKSMDRKLRFFVEEHVGHVKKINSVQKNQCERYIFSQYRFD